jgi:hypothetical protein
LALSAVSPIPGSMMVAQDPLPDDYNLFMYRNGHLVKDLEGPTI